MKIWWLSWYYHVLFHTRINCRISSNIEVAWKCERYTFILNIEIYVESQKVVSQEIFLTFLDDVPLRKGRCLSSRMCWKRVLVKSQWLQLTSHRSRFWFPRRKFLMFSNFRSLRFMGFVFMCCCFFQISILREPQGFCMILHHSTSFLCGFSPIYWPERYWGAIWRNMSGIPIKWAVQASHAVYRMIHLIALSFRCFHFNDRFCHWNSSDSKWDRQPCYHEGSPKISTSHDTTPGIAWNATVREQLWRQGSEGKVFTLQWIKH